MPDKKPTDNEIVKALECCMNGHCDDCPFRETREHCHNLDSLILDLINRQKTEIDNLKNDELPKCKDALRRANEIGRELQAENERLKEEICIQHKIIDERGAEVLRHDRCIRTLHEKLETAKAEAYKECIEKVKAIATKKKIVYVADTSIQEQEIGLLELRETALDNLLTELECD